jgi:hypothetical protein
MEIIKITKQNRSYEQFYSLTVILASIYTALQYRNSGAVFCNPKDPIVAEGSATNKMIEFPIFDIVEEVLRNVKRDCIEIVIKDFAPSPANYEKDIKVLDSTLNSIFLPFVLEFYENYAEEAKLKFGDNESHPDSWRMGWVIRNAIAHNHKIDFRDKNSKPRTWSGVTISKENDGEPIADFFNSADLIILLLEMEKSLK